MNNRIFITDRTLSDVIYALNNQSNSEMLKGSLNFTDLNRIESNMKDFSIMLKSVGYYTDLMYKVDWVESDIPDLLNINRIRDNIKHLIIKFVNIDSFPQNVKNEFLNYVEVNNWERTTELMIDYFAKMNMFKIFCGDYNCGEVINW